MAKVFNMEEIAMGLLEGLLNRAMRGYLKKHGDEFVEAVLKVNNGGDIEDTDKVIDDYFYLVKKVYKKSKPNKICLNEDNYFSILIDGIEYDFNELIRHNDSNGTECKCEIEVLLSGGRIPIVMVEDKLNRKIEMEW